MIDIFTDGACLGNPGRGGWAAILRDKGEVRRISGGEAETTNNRMELTAAIKALEDLQGAGKDEKAGVTLYCDSKYLLDGIEKYIGRWRQNGWRTADKKPVKNRDLWQLLDALTNRHRVRFVWVRGHDGHPENEEADRLAKQAAQKL